MRVTPKKLVSGLLAAALLPTGPGLCGYQAAAQTVGTSVAAPTAPNPVAAPAVQLTPASGGSLAPMQSVSLDASLVSLSPSPALTLRAGSTSIYSAAEGRLVSRAGSAAGLTQAGAAAPARSLLRRQLDRAASDAAPARAENGETATSLGSLAATERAATRALGEGDAGRAGISLRRLYSSERLASDAGDGVQGESRPHENRLQPAAAAAEETGTPQPPAPIRPVSSARRTFDVGMVTAALSALIMFGIPPIATALGYEIHSDYETPIQSIIPLKDVGFLLGAAVLAPIAEEAMWRAGLFTLAQRWFTVDGKAMTALRSFWTPALVTSVLFTLNHETSDPLLIVLRTVSAMFLAWSFHKHGLLAAITAHGLYNGLPTLALMAFAVTGSPVALLAAVAASAGVAAFSAWRLWKERAAAAAGAVRAVPMTPVRAELLALVLAAGSVAFLALAGMANILLVLTTWLPPLLGLVYWSLRQRALAARAASKK